jgi:hypothetical protein
MATHPDALAAGASGALCGLLAAVAVWLFLNRRFFPWALLARWRSGLIATLVLMVIVSLAPGVGGWAHLGGALAGAAVAWLLNVQRFGRPLSKWLALAGVVIVFVANFAVLERARAASPTWHHVEELDFRQFLLQPAIRTAQLADKVYNDHAAPLLLRHATRRQPDVLAEASAVLRHQADALGTLEGRVGAARSYRQPAVEERRRLLLEALAADRDAMFEAAACLDKGAQCTREDEEKVQRAAEQSEALWNKLLTRTDE